MTTAEKIILKDDNYEDYFNNLQNHGIFKISFQFKSYKAFAHSLQILKDLNLYNHISCLKLNIGDSNYDNVKILDNELVILSQLVASSSSLNSIKLVSFNLTEEQTKIFFDAINSNSNIKIIIFDREFDTWDYHALIFDKISHNNSLRELVLNDIYQSLFDTIDQLFNNLKDNNSLIEKIEIGFFPQNKTFEALVQFLEADNKIIILDIEYTMDAADEVDSELFDRLWQVVKQKNIVIKK